MHSSQAHRSGPCLLLKSTSSRDKQLSWKSSEKRSPTGSDSLAQQECRAGSPGAQPVSLIRVRLDDTCTATPGKPPVRSQCRQRICSTIFSGGQSNYLTIYHIFFYGPVTNAWEGSANKADSALQDWLQLGETMFLPYVTTKVAPRFTSALPPEAHQGKHQEGSGKASPAQGFMCLLRFLFAL